MSADEAASTTARSWPRSPGRRRSGQRHDDHLRRRSHRHRGSRRGAATVSISFTLETDGRLPTAPLADAIAAVDAATDHAATYFGINCAHPDHIAGRAGPWQSRVRRCAPTRRAAATPSLMRRPNSMRDPDELPPAISSWRRYYRNSRSWRLLRHRRPPCRGHCRDHQPNLGLGPLQGFCGVLLGSEAKTESRPAAGLVTKRVSGCPVRRASTTAAPADLGEPFLDADDLVLPFGRLDRNCRFELGRVIDRPVRSIASGVGPADGGVDAVAVPAMRSRAT